MFTYHCLVNQLFQRYWHFICYLVIQTFGLPQLRRIVLFPVLIWRRHHYLDLVARSLRLLYSLGDCVDFSRELHFLLGLSELRKSWVPPLLFCCQHVSRACLCVNIVQALRRVRATNWVLIWRGFLARNNIALRQDPAIRLPAQREWPYTESCC